MAQATALCGANLSGWLCPLWVSCADAAPAGWPRDRTPACRPCGVLSVSVRTQYLQNYSRESDSLTDISYLSLAPSGELSWRSRTGSCPPRLERHPSC